MSLTANDKALASDINAVFVTLENIRKKHYDANPITSMSTAFTTTQPAVGDKITLTTSLSRMKTYIQTLENSRFLTSGTFSSQVTIPAVGSLIKATFVPIDLVNNLNNIAVRSGNFSFRNFDGFDGFDGFRDNRSFSANTGFLSHNSFGHTCTPCRSF